MNLQKRINQRLQHENQKRSTELASWLTNKPIYAVGKNSETLKLSQAFNLKGIVDDFSDNSSWNGIQLLKSDSVDKNALIINCSTSISPISVKRNFQQKNFHCVVDYFELTETPYCLNLPDFSIETQNDYTLHIKNWSEVYERLSDELSKKTFEDILLFRLTCNPGFMNNYSVRLKDQYLEYFMEYSHEVMVDAGAFDGDTAELFCLEYPDYKSVHLFEPSEINISKAKKRLENFERIEYHNSGLSDAEGAVLFEDDLGSSSKVSETGDSKILVDRLDKLITQPVTLIKMDIEGWEIPALIGCKNHISQNNPKLAIAVYHKAEDFWKIPELVLSMNNNYGIYLRHYTEGWSETVMFFKPSNE
jgi:FkbM family methyltransferase